MNVKKALAIGGSDPSGGAGIQADIMTMTELAVYPYTALTAITAQNSGGVASYEILSSRMMRAQIDAILNDTDIDGVKTGMLGSSENITEVALFLTERPGTVSVIDPVIRATDGKVLTSEASTAVFKKRLLPRAFMVTPNIDEARLLTGVPINGENDLIVAAKALKETGAEWILIKGGHLPGPTSVDLLYDGVKEYYFEAVRLEGMNTRGTGCMMASAICAYLAHGLAPYEAVDKAKAYVLRKIKGALLLGKGSRQALPVLLIEATSDRNKHDIEDTPAARGEEVENRLD